MYSGYINTSVQSVLESIYPGFSIRILHEASGAGMYVELKEKYNDFAIYYTDNPATLPELKPPVTVYLPYMVIGDGQNVTAIYELIEAERKKLLTINGCCDILREALKFKKA